MKKIYLTLIIVILLLPIVYAQENFADKPLPEDKTNQILLKSRQITPEKGIPQILKDKITARAPKSTHVLLQFNNIPTNEEKEELKNQGIDLIAYIPNKAWFAAVPPDNLDDILSLSIVKSISEILPEDKISPHITAGNFYEARVKNGRLDLIVEFFKDVSLDEGEIIIENHGGVISGRVPTLNALVINLPKESIIDLGSKDSIMWIEQELPLEALNDGARAAMNVDTVQASPFILDGTDIDVLVYDAGLIDDTHDDFGSRVTIGESGSVSDHATHVAGTVGGDGTLSSGTFRGMAPAVDLISYFVSGSCSITQPNLCLYDDSGQMADFDANFNEGITTHGADIGTASVGAQPAQWEINCDFEGDYSPFAQLIDTIIHEKAIPITWAAANERGWAFCGTSYNTISPTATAKNAIIVGATNSNDDSMTSFSGWGPVDDGRVKPDVVAPGCQVGGDNGITSTIPGDAYDSFCGTSMATPATAGTTSLLLQEYRSTHTNEPLPSTLKAILIQTAVDLGNAGPDYKFGHGRINALAAINKIDEDAGLTNVIEEESISNGQTTEFEMTVASTVKVTLVWDDVPATANANPTLVNDLDLVLIAPDSTVFSPWVLDPANPANTATTGTNTIDNVEQVFVAGAQAGIWTIRITGTSVPTGPQNFSLVSDHSFTIKPIVNVKTFRDSYTTEDKFFDNAQEVFIEANVTIRGQPAVGNSVTADLILSSGTIEDTLALTEVGNGIYRNSWDSTTHTNDVYQINVTATGNGIGIGNNKFHLYSGSGVSAYLFDFNEDGEDDKVLENKHIISIFKRQLNNSPILYYEQKDTNVSYSFLDSPYENATSRGGISTDEFTVTLNFSSCSSGENLQSASTNMELLKVNPSIASPPLDSTSQACGTNCNECTNNDACGTPTCRQQGGTKAYIDDIRIDATVVEPNSEITVEIDNVQSFTSDCSAIYYKAPGGSFQQVLCRCPPQFTIETNSVTFNVGSASGTGIIRATMNDGGFSCVVCSTSRGENDKMEITIASVTEESFDFLADVNISVDTEDVDYLVYNLRNFDETAFPDSIFSDIYGTLGSSVADDRYHLQTGADALISSLASNQWNNFDSNYTIIYDNSNSDDVNDNILAFVRFNETNGITLQDVGLWSGSEGLRIRYNVTQATASDEINYILAFTKGDFQTIDQWMPTIQSNQFPTLNFLTAPSAELISITLLGFPVDFGNLDTSTINSSAIGNVDDSYIIQVDSVTTVNVDIYKKGDNFISGATTLDIENVVYDDDKVLEKDADATNPETILTNTYGVTPYFSNIAPNTNKNIYYWISIPESQQAGDYSTTFFIKAVETGTLP